MFKLFRRKAKKVEIEPENKVVHDEYEVYRLMSKEDLEAEAQAKDAQANRLAKKWNGMNEAEQDENSDMYFEFWNLRKEARFLRELKDNPQAKAPEFFKLMSPKPAHKIESLMWDFKTGKEKK